jgi:hypothetical protein
VTASTAALMRVAEVWPGSPQSAVFRVEAATDAEASRAACDEAKRIGYRVKTRGYTVQAAPGVFHVELRVRRAEA